MRARNIAIAVAATLALACAPKAPDVPVPAPVPVLEGSYRHVSLGSGRTLMIPARGHSGPSDLREDAWYLLDTRGLRLVARDLLVMFVLGETVLSPDGSMLAVGSSGEGHPCVQVLDVKTLVEGRDLDIRPPGAESPAELHLLCTYPGGVTIEEWRGSQLVVRTDSLLTVEDAHGNTPHCLLDWGGFDEEEAYGLSPPDWQPVPLTPRAMNPEQTFLATVPTDPAALAQRACALRWLVGFSALPEIRAIRERVPREYRDWVDIQIQELSATEAASP